ncbi:MAG: hypothetical protein KTR19_10150, partial [Hyphomicrobiales bacterium]|nr:hypothetical protein [Hyphomicrobiales bacterium]
MSPISDNVQNPASLNNWRNLAGDDQRITIGANAQPGVGEAGDTGGFSKFLSVFGVGDVAENKAAFDNLFS